MKHPVPALVKSDFVKLISLRRSLALFAVILLFLFTSPQFFSLGVIMLVYGGVFSLLAYEQSAAAYHWYGSLPVTRRQVFLAKYLFSTALLLLAMVLMFILSTPIGLAVNRFDGPTLLASLMVSWLLGCLFISITLPLTMLLGTIKARYAVMFLYFAVFFFSTSLLENGGMARLLRFLQSPLLPWLVFLGGLAVMVLSYLICVSFYSRKEFIDEL